MTVRQTLWDWSWLEDDLLDGLEDEGGVVRGHDVAEKKKWRPRKKRE